MSTSKELLARIERLSVLIERETVNGRDKEFIACLAEAIQRLSSSWQLIREVELHKEYHLNQRLPGERPIGGNDF